MKKWILKKLHDWFYSWPLIRDIVQKAVDQSRYTERKEFIRDIVSRVNLDKTIAFLEQHKKDGEKYWSLAQFIDEEISKNYK